MDIEQRFQSYADAFELAYADNDWSRVAPYFSEDASYDAGDGSDVAQGREVVLLKLQGAVDGLDRKMDQRELVLHSISSDGDTVTAPWTVRYSKHGLPALAVSGKEVARFSGDAMTELRSVIEERSIAAFGAWLAAHGENL